MARKKKVELPSVPVIKVETETGQTPPISKKNDYTGDPMWNARRRRLDISITLCFFTIFVSMSISVEMAAVVVPAAFIAIGGQIGLYFGVSEWGRINGVLGVTTKTETSVNTKVDPQKEE